MNLDVILYYADFLSMKNESIPVTDPCKYFFINKLPTNISTICDTVLFFDSDNKYIEQAMAELQPIEDKYGEEGVMSYIDDICYIRACGMVDAKRMLEFIHRWSDRYTRKQAFKKYNKYISDTHYYITIKDDDGESRRIECSKYVAEYTPNSEIRHESTL